MVWRVEYRLSSSGAYVSWRHKYFDAPFCSKIIVIIYASLSSILNGRRRYCAAEWTYRRLSRAGWQARRAQCSTVRPMPVRNRCDDNIAQYIRIQSARALHTFIHVSICRQTLFLLFFFFHFHSFAWWRTDCMDSLSSVVGILCCCWEILFYMLTICMHGTRPIGDPRQTPASKMYGNAK